MTVAAKAGTRRDIPEIEPVPQRRQRVAVTQGRIGSVESSLQSTAALGANTIAAPLAASDPRLQVLAVAWSLFRHWPSSVSAS